MQCTDRERHLRQKIVDTHPIMVSAPIIIIFCTLSHVMESFFHMLEFLDITQLKKKIPIHMIC